MTRVSSVLGCGAAALSLAGLIRAADAAPILSSVTHAGTASAATASGDYHYGTFGRYGHQYTGWLLRPDQATLSSAASPLNGSLVETSTASFFGPVCSAATTVSATFSDTDALSVLHIRLKAALTLTTPRVPHQSVSTTAQASDTFTFTLANDADVRLDVSGAPGQVVQITDVYSGENIFTADGTGSFRDALGPGEYRITGSFAASARQDTQSNTFTNLGSSVSTLDYTFSASTPS